LYIIGLGAEGAEGLENEPDFHNQTKGFKLSRTIKAAVSRPSFCVKIQLNASSPSFVHGIGWMLVDV
jgi:hypothetical protein